MFKFIYTVDNKGNKIEQHERFYSISVDLIFSDYTGAWHLLVLSGWIILTIMYSSSYFKSSVHYFFYWIGFNSDKHIEWEGEGLLGSNEIDYLIPQLYYRIPGNMSVCSSTLVQSSVDFYR